MSTTRAVSIREFRENLTRFLKEAQEKDVHFIVMRHADPIAHVSPICDDEASIEALAARVAKARKDADEGRIYTAQQVLAMIDRYASRVHRGGSGRSRKASPQRRTKNRAEDAVVRSARTSPVVRKKTR